MKKQLFQRTRNWRGRTSALFVSLLMLVLVACEAPRMDSDVNAVHKNSLSTETLTLEITGEVNHEISGAAFRYLLREYHMRAKGPMAVEVRRAGLVSEEIDGNIADIVAALNHAGVRDADIIVLPTPAGGQLNAVISFTANMVTVPDCGDWSTSGTANWANVPQGNFGCATQRNRGLMIANPGDLNSAQTMSNMSGNRGATIVRSVLGTPAPAAAGGAGAAGAAGAAGGVEVIAAE
jgi:type IV pilus biogenesis protein CpaD/CtpE